jgi:hypothetical protein
MDSQSDWFSYYMCLNATKIFSMDMTISSLYVYMTIEISKMWLWQEVGDPQLQSLLQKMGNPHLLEKLSRFEKDR